MEDHEPETRQPRIKARVHAEHLDRIHNDLGSAARYFERRVRDRLAVDDRDGMFFEMVAAVMMAAFAMEANLNFIGQEIIEGWDDWSPFGKKLKLTLKHLGIEADMNRRPYLSIGRLKQVRDAIAHGKPQVVKFEVVTEGTHEELERLLWYRKAEWEDPITPEFVREAYEDVQEIWSQLLEASGIDPIATLTHGVSGIDFLGHVDQPDP